MRIGGRDKEKHAGRLIERLTEWRGRQSKTEGGGRGERGYGVNRRYREK